MTWSTAKRRYDKAQALLNGARDFLMRTGADSEWDMMFERIKRITSHVGVSRFLHDSDTAGFIIRQPDIPSPYASGPSHVVWRVPYRGGTALAIIVETAHKRYDVFRLPVGIEVYSTDDEATTAFLAARKAAEGRAAT